MKFKRGDKVICIQPPVIFSQPGMYVGSKHVISKTFGPEWPDDVELEGMEGHSWMDIRFELDHSEFQEKLEDLLDE